MQMQIVYEKENLNGNSKLLWRFIWSKLKISIKILFTCFFYIEISCPTLKKSIRLVQKTELVIDYNLMLIKIVIESVNLVFFMISNIKFLFTSLA